MEHIQRFTNNAVKYSLAAIAGAVVLAIFWPTIQNAVTGPSSFLPHSTCYLNDPGLIWLHVTSDSLIGIAYVSISLTLAYLVQVARVPFHLAFVAFGVFIGACGATHFMEVWTVFEPYYWLAGAMKVITAAASVATAVWLFPLLPQAIKLAKGTELAEERRVKLESAHQELQSLYSRISELDTLKTQFFNNVSHELRTPLALILGPAEKLAKSPELSRAQRADLQVIQSNARMLLKHVNDLLDISKLDARKMHAEYSEVDIARALRVMNSNFSSLAAERMITHTISAPDSLIAQVDAEKLDRILLNLLSNAFKYVPDGGKVDCQLSSREGKAILSIQDSGPGIAPEMREAIFERFRQLDGGTTRQFGGTGLGLSIVKEFVQLQKGTIHVGQSRLGGAEFIIELPLVAPENAQPALAKNASADPAASKDNLVAQAVDELRTKPAAPAVAAAPSVPFGAPVVLVAEDNQDMNQFICDALAADYRVISTRDGQEALKKAQTERPDIILTDLMMPRMSGEQLLLELRADEQIKHIPVIVLTAKADDELRLKLLRAGAQDYLMKPLLVDELLARVRNFIALKRTREVLQSELASRSENLEAMARTLASRKREFERARNQAEDANRTKDEFLATLSHELRTPLTAVLGWTRLLQSGSLDEATEKRAIDTIERNARSQVQLIEDLLDMSRIITGKLSLTTRPIEVAPLIEAAADSIRPAIEAKNIELSLRLTRAGCLVLGDPDRLQQVIWNLVNNAVKFTPKNGKVDISLAVKESLVEVRISDNGQGIAPEFLPHLFERFKQADSSTTRRYGGLGLGLAISRHLVELHGGTIKAESAGPGEGATFSIMLPVLGMRTNENITSLSRGMVHKSRLSDLTILMVEDDDDTRGLLKNVLEASGAKVVAVHSVAAALNEIGSSLPDLLVSDIGMPDEDGYALIRKIRALSPQKGGNLPALALTAYAKDEDQNRILAAGFQAFISKPADPEEITAAVARLAGRN